MRSSFGIYCGRFVTTASIVAVLVGGSPVMDGGATAAAQSKTVAAKKKKGSSAPANQKKTSASQKKTSSNQKKTSASQNKTSGTRKNASSPAGNKATQVKKQANTGKGKASTKANTVKSKGTPTSSAEAKRLQEAAQKEIQQTREQLRLNEQQIKTGLSDLNRLSGEIADGRKKVDGLKKKVASLDGEISGLGKEIAKNESDLKLMREEYLKAVKKMRTTKRNQSTLAFIFASENFNQAMRRIRYMRQFSAWKERKSSDIADKVARLSAEKESLAKAKEAQAFALGELNKSQSQLEENHGRQTALVAELRRNGDALQAHLTAKQKEANRLKESISALIAQEQAKAEAERRAREKKEAERIAREKAEAERKAAELAAAEKAAAEKAAAEKAAAEKAAEKALKEKLAAEKALAEKSAAEKAAAEKEAAEKAKAYKKAQEEKEKADRKFAEAKAKAEEKMRKEREKKNSERSARKKKDRVDRKDGAGDVELRNSEALAGESSKSAEKASAGGGNVNFASLRGNLPRPVEGSWRITNPFGRHAMPEMPEIEYDNPGIDAEVAKGSTVKSVCGGKVSGVYKVAGYGTVVIVNHGDYYTVYGNLASTNVSVGTQVGGGHALGTAGSDPDDPRQGSVHFEVWKGREKQNPSAWMR